MLDTTGLDIRGRHIDVPYVEKHDTLQGARFGGILDSSECNSLPMIKLINFTSYSLDDGQTWHEFGKNTCLVGVKKWREVYVVLFDGLPRTLAYAAKEPKRYYDNVVPIRPHS